MIGDFGLSQQLDSKCKDSTLDKSSVDSQTTNPLQFSAKNSQSLTKNIGTPLYLAPEQEKGEDYDEKVDIYALGLILLEMFINIRTLHERMKLFNDIKKLHKIPEFLSKSYKYEADLILMMTNCNPKERPSSDKIEKIVEFRDLKQALHENNNLN